ncbi:MAG: peptide chain release factor 2 [Clostridia bacterium]|nr:peptide chain release factor 2 [Clostridia bacterium]
MDFYSENQRLQEITSSVKTSTEAIGIAKLTQELAEMKEKQNDEDFWKDVDIAREVSRKIAVIEKKLETVNSITKSVKDAQELLELAEESNDAEIAEEAAAYLDNLESDAKAFFLEALMKGKYDSNNAILTIHAGAGGTEAQDWAEMLYRMYTRYAERERYTVQLLDYQAGDEAGIKSVTIQINGNNAYGYLKAEKGVHRLVRISPFDANKRRHTSFASLEVMPEIINDNEIKINPDEIKIETCRSSGAGGQNVNKVESAVRITHIPTGLITWCQNDRSQLQNKEVAMKMLISKLIERREREQMEEELKIKGELKKIEWGSQIRSYVFCPYTLVKDHRTGCENTNVNAVMDGDIEMFINEYLIATAN